MAVRWPVHGFRLTGQLPPVPAFRGAGLGRLEGVQCAGLPMHPPVGSRGVYRFGDFEFDPRTAELRRQGRKVRLREQPAQVLTLLLTRPGELVTREEATRALWPDDTFVDFDIGLNSAVKRLRDALADSAERPRFVETLPKRG